MPTPFPFADDVDVCDWVPPVAEFTFRFEEFPELETLLVEETFPIDAFPPVAV